MNDNGVTRYLEALSDEEQIILSAIRRQILDLVPNIEERLSRGVPFFYYRGKRAFGFRSSKKHLSFFIMEGNVLAALHHCTQHYDNSSTVIRFTIDKPLTAQLIEKLVLARISEIDRALSKKGKK